MIAKHIGTATKLKKSAPNTSEVADVYGVGTAFCRWARHCLFLVLVASFVDISWIHLWDFGGNFPGIWASPNTWDCHSVSHYIAYARPYTMLTRPQFRLMEGMCIKWLKRSLRWRVRLKRIGTAYSRGMNLSMVFCKSGLRHLTEPRLLLTRPSHMTQLFLKCIQDFLTMLVCQSSLAMEKVKPSSSWACQEEGPLQIKSRDMEPW